MTATLDRYVGFVRSGDWSGWDPRVDVWPTRGVVAIPWMTSMLIHGPGDLLGEPLTFRDDQKEWLAEWYEFNPLTGRWRFDEALKGEARGGVKTELAAAVAMAELDGPPGVRAKAPDIPVAAVSRDNADQLYSVCVAMAGGRGEVGDSCPLQGRFHVHEGEILSKEHPTHKIVKVASEAGSSHGGRPSLWVVDELHEVVGRKGDAITVLRKGLLKKRPRARFLGITTAGAAAGSDPASDADGLAWRLYLQGLRQRSDPDYKPRFFFDWRQASDDLDPADPADVAQGIREASGAADIAFDVEDRVADFLDDADKADANIRAYWNKWQARSASGWLARSPGAWTSALVPGAKLVDGQAIWIGLDGAISGDTMAVSTVGHHGEAEWLWGARVFDADEGGRRAINWKAVREHIDCLVETYAVLGIAYDPTMLTQFTASIEDDLGLNCIEVPQSVTRRAKIDEWARSSIVGGSVVHAGDQRLSDHVGAAQWRHSGELRVLSKKSSVGKIDALIACAMAHWHATSPTTKSEKRPSKLRTYVIDT